MLTLNLAKLGVTEEALQAAILGELNLSPEQAIKALAEKLGVSLGNGAAPVKAGDTVQTEQGESRAAILTSAEAQTLKEAGAIAQRIFG